jgi:HSP20 family protein
MNLVRYNPNRGMSTKCNTGSNLFDDLFDDFFSPVIAARRPTSLRENLNLMVDIYEKDDQIVIEAELPGVEKEDISVDVKGKLVTLGGERKSGEEIKDETYYRRERKHGKFERTFNLPFEVKGDHVKAYFNNGILKLEISKPEEQVAKKITVN